MEDISNKTLAILLVFAMAVSLGGTLISLNRLRLVNVPGAPSLVGFAIGTGKANLTITQDSTITVVSNIIDFGTGIINVSAGCTNATIASSHNATNRTADYDPCWVSNATTPAMVLFTDEDIVIRNDGNINVTLTMDSTQNTAATFIGGTATTPLYQYRAFGNETEACDDAVNSSWFNINATTTMAICNKLKSDNSQDEVRVAIKISIPKDATGYKEDTLTFTSS